MRYVCLDCAQVIDGVGSRCRCGITWLSTTPTAKPRTKRVEVKVVVYEYCGNKTCTCGATE